MLPLRLQWIETSWRSPFHSYSTIMRNTATPSRRWCSGISRACIATTASTVPSKRALDRGALETAAREDREAAAGRVNSAPLWGVPIVIKANTSIAGEVTTDGWSGYTIPGHELVAPRDATIVAKLRAAGAVLIGHTNMPDFANADTNRSTSFGRTGNAYDVRFSPGGSSGGTVTAVTSNMAVLGNGTDTGNSIRMPSATSGVVGVFPTRGLVSIAGIAPLDWLLDNTGPIARNVTDATIALSVMAGPDSLDPPTHEAATKAEPGPYTTYLKADALKGRRFGVPAFILGGMGPPFHGVPASVPDVLAEKQAADQANPLDPATRTAFLKAVEELRAAGATIVMDDTVLSDSFVRLATRVATYPYVKEGTDLFLRNFGPAQYHSAAEYEELMGQPLGEPIIGAEKANAQFGDITLTQRKIENDPDAEANYYGPRRRLMEAYLSTMERLHLDGYVYPAIQMPPVDETMAQNGRLSEGPHSDTSWVNMLGVPAVVVVGGYYPAGCRSGWRFQGSPGTTENSWGTPTDTSRPRITAIRRCWWNRDCSPARRRLGAAIAPQRLKPGAGTACVSGGRCTSLLPVYGLK